MVRPMTPQRKGAWKAGLAIAVIGGGLLWHILACTESPMAFSPDSKQLAFVAMDPWSARDDNVAIAGTHVYRLMVLTEGKELTVVEETSACMLSAPAFSPDGRSFAYIRIPLFKDAGSQLLAEDDLKKREQLVKQAGEWEAAPGKPDEKGNATAPVPATYLPPPPSAATQGEMKATPAEAVEDVALPPAENARGAVLGLTPQAPLNAVLVVRDAKTRQVTSATEFGMPVGEPKGEAFLLNYGIIRPQFDAEGKWIYFWANNVVLAICPSDHKERIMAVPASLMSLSPDGKTLATVQEGAVGFLRTDGESALYRKWKQDNLSLSGIAWANKQTLALLWYNKAKKDDKEVATPMLDLLRSDGSAPKSMAIEALADVASEGGELAISPNGDYMVLATTKEAFFLKANGKLLGRRPFAEGEILCQPTFTPDSKQVAFKDVTGKETARVTAIVFFTPEGKEVSRADVPASKPLEKKPAEK